MIYQWYLNGSAISGATLSGFSVADAQAQDAGDYTVTVTDSLGAITSAVATLYVTEQLPSFNLEPLSQRVFPGLSAGFSAAAEGTEPIRYQWQFNGVDLPGESGEVLSLAAVDLMAAGSYQLVASNQIGVTTNTAALLSVVPVLAWGWDALGPNECADDARRCGPGFSRG